MRGLFPSDARRRVGHGWHVESGRKTGGVEVTTMYTVWVGGIEVTDCVMPLDDANKVAEYWRDLGYDDVELEEVTA